LACEAQDVDLFGEGNSHVLGMGRCEGGMRQVCIPANRGRVAPHQTVYLLRKRIKLHNMNNCRQWPPKGADSKICVQGPNLRWADCFVAPRFCIFSPE